MGEWVGNVGGWVSMGGRMGGLYTNVCVCGYVCVCVCSYMCMRVFVWSIHTHS